MSESTTASTQVGSVLESLYEAMSEEGKALFLEVFGYND